MREAGDKWLWVAWATQAAFTAASCIATWIVIFFLFQGLANVRDWWAIDTRNVAKTMDSMQLEIDALTHRLEEIENARE